VAGVLSLAVADGDWPLRTLAVSSRSGVGIDALVAAFEAYRAHLTASRGSSGSGSIFPLCPEPRPSGGCASLPPSWKSSDDP